MICDFFHHFETSSQRMKTCSSIALLVIGSALALTAYGEEIHVVCDPSTDGFAVFVPHPYECEKFFLCQGPIGIEMHCPAGLQFDANLNICNYPSVVNCVNTPYPTTSTEAIETTTTQMNTTTTEEPETTTQDGEETTVFEEYQDYSL